MLQGRLKSLYSTYKKMQRKGVGLEEIYDACALRVIINDGGNRQNPEAMAACYQVNSACLCRPHPFDCNMCSAVLGRGCSGLGLHTPRNQWSIPCWQTYSLYVHATGPGGSTAPLEAHCRGAG